MRSNNQKYASLAAVAPHPAATTSAAVTFAILMVGRHA